MPSNFQKANRQDKHYEEHQEEEEKARAHIAQEEPDATQSPHRTADEQAEDERLKKIHQGRM